MSSRNNNNKKNSNGNKSEEFPDELELQLATEPQRRPQKVKNIKEPLDDDNGSNDNGSNGDDEDHSSDQDSSEEENDNLYDVMTDFFVNDNGENVATVLTNIQSSLDQHAKCILKLTKVIQEIAGKSHK
jgi:hypothetical protein